MKKICLVLAAMLLPWVWQPAVSLISSVFASTIPNPITVTLDSPLQGSTVSNIITLSATASSSAAPITKVEFYLDGMLIGTVTNKPPAPANFKVQ